MSSNVWVYVDSFKGQALPVSWEALGAGKQIAAKLEGAVTALVFDAQGEAAAQEAFRYGSDAVTLAADATLADFRAEAFASLLSKLAGEAKPEIILFPNTTRGRELAAMCAIDLNTGVLADVIALEVENGALTATRPVYGGKLLSKVTCAARPQLVTLRSRAFPKAAYDAARSGTPTRLAAALSEAQIPTRVVEYAQAQGGISLSDAAVVVSGGRGVSNNPALTPPAGLDEKQAELWRAQQGFKLVSELAQAVGGAVGASRAAVDAGYIPYEHQVGQTGKVVTPDIYIACGISGAIQHLAGMRTSKMIVAINKDSEAPIFKLARFGAVGDLHTLLPAITAAFRKRLGK